MTYFTTKRLIRLQDRPDEQRFLAALDDWEHALEDYRRQLNDIQHESHAIRPQVFASLKFLTTMSLHDARVLDIDWGDGHHLRITLQPGSQPEPLVALTYSLIQPPHIEHNVLPEQLRSESISWLYDELTLAEWKDEEEQVFRQNILLSDGREIGLLFRDVAIERPVSLAPGVPADPASA